MRKSAFIACFGIVVLFVMLFSLAGCGEVDPWKKAVMNTDLISAAEEGNLDRVKELLDMGADVNTENISGMTPLDVAESAGHTEVVDLLKGRGGVSKYQPSTPLAPVDSSSVDTSAVYDQGYSDGFDKGLYVYQHMAEVDLETAAQPPTGPYETQEEQDAYKDGWGKGYSEGLDKGADIENAAP